MSHTTPTLAVTINNERFYYIPYAKDYAISLSGNMVSNRTGDKWKKKVTNQHKNTGYLQCSLMVNDTHYVRMIHQLIYSTFVSGEDIPKGMMVDHKDHDQLNNNPSNLRLVTPSENRMNSVVRKDNVSGYKGIHKKGDKFQVTIRINGKAKAFGTFEDIVEAVKTYNDAAIKLRGEFAVLSTVPSSSSTDLESIPSE